jgi:hypothetical protein
MDLDPFKDCFACPQQHLMAGYPPPMTDDYYYSKFNCTGKHMKKLQRGCSVVEDRQNQGG